MRAGDLIVAVGGQPLDRRGNALNVIRQRALALPPDGGTIEVVVLRNGVRLPLTLRFNGSPGSRAPAPAPSAE
jgi:hypothetical protein